MRTLFDYLRLLTFFAAALLGVQLPGLVEQYGQNLAAREAEAARALAPFQADAERHTEGDIDALIERYRASGDPLFTDGGQSISQLAERHEQLAGALAQFRSSPWAAWWHTFVHPVKDVREQVLAQYSYTVKLTPEAIGMGLLLGLLIASLLEGCARGCVHGTGKALAKMRRKKVIAKTSRGQQRRPPRIS